MPRKSKKNKKESSGRISRKAKKNLHRSVGNIATASYFNYIFNAFTTLSPAEQVTFGLSICSLFTAILIWRKRRQLNENTSDMPLNLPKSKSKTRFSRSQLSDSLKEQIKKSLHIPVIKGKVSSKEVTSLFHRALNTKRPQQILIADVMLQQVFSWKAIQLEHSAQSIVVNFLLWYYRTLETNEDLSPEQADHIRYWADFTIKEDTDWGFYNVKFDYLYSIALLSKSMPHIRIFYKWLLSEDQNVRHPPAKKYNRKQNYYLTRFQTACILGKWSDVYVMAAHLRRLIEGKNVAQSAITPGNTKGAEILLPRTDHFMHYTLKAIEQPSFNPNFAMVYQATPFLEQEFDLPMLPPPVFTTWHVYQYRYRNMDESVTQMVNNSFVFTSEKFLDEEGFYKWYPAKSSGLIARVPKTIKIWGRICQMVSPLTGSAGFLPMTGSWSDTKIYMQTDWTYRAMRTQLTRKQGILEMERTPKEKTVDMEDMLGSGKRSKTGYLWKGKLSVYTKQLQSMKNNSLATSMVVSHSLLPKVMGNEVNENVNEEGNGNIFKDLIMEMDDDEDISLMIYEVEMVIANDDWDSKQREKDKERTAERIQNLLAKNRGNGEFGIRMSGLKNKEKSVRQAFANMSSDSSVVSM